MVMLLQLVSLQPWVIQLLLAFHPLPLLLLSPSVLELLPILAVQPAATLLELSMLLLQALHLPILILVSVLPLALVALQVLLR